MTVNPRTVDVVELAEEVEEFSTGSQEKEDQTRLVLGPYVGKGPEVMSVGWALHTLLRPVV